MWSESVTAPFNVKLADYGISCPMTDGGVNTLCGTLGFQAPEQIVSRRNRGESFDLRVRTSDTFIYSIMLSLIYSVLLQVDIFAYAMTLYVILTGIHPFEKEMKEPFMVEEKVRRNEYPPLPTGQSLVYLQFLINRCWRYWPSERPSASQIVAEMCEPSFLVQCKDLFVSGRYCVLATTVTNDGALFTRPNRTEATGTVPEGEVRFSSKDLSSSGLGQSPDISSTVCCNPNLPAASLSNTPSTHETKPPSPILRSSSLGSSLRSMLEDFTKTGSVAHSKISTSCTEDWDHLTAKRQSREYSSDNKQEAEFHSQQSEDDLEIDSDFQTLSLALVATTDSLLVAVPQRSHFLCAQKLKITYGVVSAMLFLKDRLWVGLHPQVRSDEGSGQLQVFECIGGEICRRVRHQTFSCNDVIEDIKCQLSVDGKHAAVLGLLGNGEILVVRGQIPSTTQGRLNFWGEDGTYQWDYPEVRQVGKVDPETAESAQVVSRLVVARPPVFWYCQGNTILALATKMPAEREPFKVIPVACSNETFVTVPGFRIKDAVVLGDTVWFSSSDETTRNTLQAVDVASRNLIGRWTLQEIVRVDLAKRHAARSCSSKRLAMVPPKSVQCLTAVCDTLWVGCNNGAILVVHQDSRDTPLHLLATLWCRPVLTHALAKKRAQPPSVMIREMRQVGDRVLIYHDQHTDADKSAEQTIVAEVFQALNSSQFQELTAYYDVCTA